jgi:3-mercaptopyruvate sulfurtransferase SseA
MVLGYRKVRPLLGGLDAWADAGYDIEHLSVQPVMVAGTTVTSGHAH